MFRRGYPRASFKPNISETNANLSSTQREIDPDTSNIRGLRNRIPWFSLYGIHVPGFPYTRMPQTCKHKRHCSGYGVAMDCYIYIWTPHFPRSRYCEVTMTWPLLFHGIRTDHSGTTSNAPATSLKLPSEIATSDLQYAVRNMTRGLDHAIF